MKIKRYPLTIENFKKIINSSKNRLNIYLIIICIIISLINIIFLKKLELGIVTLIFRNQLNDFLAIIIILSYININISFIGYEIKSLKILIIITLLIAFVWEYFAIFIKPNSVFDYLDIFTYLIGSIVYWMIINNFYNE
jgi:hypothetical protein